MIRFPSVFLRHIACSLLSALAWAEQVALPAPPEAALWLDAGHGVWTSDWKGTSASPGGLDGSPVSIHRLPFSLSSLLDRRICFDLPLKADARAYHALEVRLHIDNPQALRWMWIIFQSADGRLLKWDGMILAPGWQTLLVPLSEFSGRSEDWGDLRSVRIAYWKGRSEDAVCSLSVLRFVQMPDLAANVILNSSFEMHSPEGIPVGWGVNHWGIRHQGRMLAHDRLRESWGVIPDDSAPDGAYCLQLRNVDGFPPIQASSCRLRLLADREHVVSWYARSPRGDAGMQVQVVDPGNGNVYQSEEVTIREGWSRFSFRHHSKRDSGILRFLPHAEAKEIRIDAVQVEPVVDTAPALPSRYRAGARDALVDVPADWGRSSGDVAVIPVRSMIPARKPLATPIAVSIQNRCLAVNGIPMVVSAFFHDGRQTLGDDLLADLGRRGFNTVVCEVQEQPDELDAAVAADVREINRFARAGLYVIPWFRKSCSTEFISAWAARVLSGNVNILALYVYDEPKEADMPVVTAKFDSIKRGGVSVPCFINYDNYWQQLPGDIACLDDYPVPNGNPSYGMLADTMWRLGAKAGKPVWFWYQLCGNAYSWYREPTPQEQEGMLYALLVNRVTGFFAFTNYPLSNRLLDRTSSLLAEIDALAPVIVGPECRWQPTASSGNIAILAKEHGAERYLITVNTGRYPRPGVRIPLSPFWARDVVAVFEDRRPSVADGAIVDDFGPYQRHVYRVLTSADGKR